MRALAFILLVFTGCNFIDEPHYEVDSRLRPFVDQFFIEAELRGIYFNTDLFARIDDLEGTVAGRSNGYKIPSIIIDIDFYESNIARGRDYDLRIIEMTVFHELGHALLGLEHIEKAGIMAIETKEWHKYASDSLFRETAIDNLFFKGQ